MNESDSTRPNGVQAMRQIRDAINTQIAGMSYEELALWLTRDPHTDPLLARLAASLTDAKAAEDRASSYRSDAGSSAKRDR